MRAPQEGDIIRIKGGERYGLYEVTAKSRTPGGPVFARGAGGEAKQIAKEDAIIVTRRGNRYDYSLNGEVIE